MKYPSTYCVFDLETSGLNPKKDKILQIAAATFVGDIKTAEMNVYLNQAIDIPPFITSINGIDNILMEQKGIHPEDALKQFFSMCEGFPVVGHNILKFDIPFLVASDPTASLLQALDTAALTCAYALNEEQSWDETFQEFQDRMLHPTQKKYSLSVACDHFEIDRSGGQHHGLDDVLLTAQLYQKLCLE